MYEFDEYNNLAARFGSFASWAIWDNEDPCNTKVIEECYGELHSRCVLIGLNVSRLLDGPVWSNFHDNTHARKLRFACNNTILRGSYMTDLFKDLVEPSSTNIESVITKNVIDKNVQLFNLEMSSVKISEATKFIIFGSLAKKYFTNYFRHDYGNRVIFCSHYSARGTDQDWVNNFWKLLEIDQLL